MKTLLRISIVLIAAATLNNCRPGADNPSKNKESREESAAEALPVQVVKPQRADISAFLNFSSNIDSEQVVDIYPQASGIITEIHYDEGQSVSAGAILARLDDREALIAENKSRLNFEQLSREFQRQKDLYERNLVSRDVYDRFRHNLEAARLDWESAKLALSFTRISTPISGLVSTRHIKVGNKISVSQLAFRVVNDREKISVINIPEQEKAAVRVGQQALVAAGELVYQAAVKRISPAIDPASGTFKVTVGLKENSPELAIGQFVNVRIIRQTNENALLLSKEAIIYEGGRTFVFVVEEEDRVKKKEIRTGFEEAARIEIMSGLEEDDTVITAGKNTLKDGDLIKVVSGLEFK